MRTKAAALGIVVGATWSLGASAQLQPPPPMPPAPQWGPAPVRQPPPQWGPAPVPQPAPQWGPPPPQSATVQRLNASDSAESFRRFEIVYVNAEVGGGYVSPGDKVASSSSQGGLVLGLGAGLRFLTWTLGIRGRVAPLSAYTLIEANAEAGFHLPVGAWDPYLNVHGGYARASMSGPSPSGGDLGGSVGADYYLSALFSLGVDATLDALFLSAGGQSSTGVALLGSAHAGLHFDL